MGVKANQSAGSTRTNPWRLPTRPPITYHVCGPLTFWMTHHVLVVGAGLSGSAAAWFLQREFGSRISVHVWDGARGAGGRLATARLNPDNPVWPVANMGAQRLHYNPSLEPDAKILVNYLLQKGIVLSTALNSNNQKHQDQMAAVIPAGSSNAICKTLMADARQRFRTRVKALWMRESGDGYKVVAQAFSDRKAVPFDGLIFCGSVAEVMTTHGDLDMLVKPYKSQLRKVRYTRQCCAAIVFASGAPSARVMRIFGIYYYKTFFVRASHHAYHTRTQTYINFVFIQADANVCRVPARTFASLFYRGILPRATWRR